MFSESAELYDVIYASFKEYEAEVAQIASLIERAHPVAPCRATFRSVCKKEEAIIYLIANNLNKKRLRT